MNRLKDQVRSALAWQSIVADIRELKLNLDQFQARQAGKSLLQAEATTGFDDGLQRAVKENCNVLRFKNAEFEGDE